MKKVLIIVGIIILLILAFIFIIVPSLTNDAMDNIRNESCCTNIGGTWKNNTCKFNNYATEEQYNNCLGK